MSNDDVGLVLVGLTVLFSILGYLLSRAGLNKVDNAAQQVQNVAKDAKQTVAAAQRAVVDATGAEAATVAANTSEVAATTTRIDDAIGQVNEALSGLTGNQAPARVAWALALLTLVAALVSFDLISLAVSPDAKAAGS